MNRKELNPQELPRQFKHLFCFDTQFINHYNQCSILHFCIDCGIQTEQSVRYIRERLKLNKFTGLCQDCASSYNIPRGRHSLMKSGYMRITDPYHKGHSILEHRLIAEMTLERPLREGENIHHINGRKYDNDPENLEVWTTVQPSGVRLSDIEVNL